MWISPSPSVKVADIKLKAIADTKVGMVASSCQQCLRTIATKARRQKMNLVVKDLIEMVFETTA